jgi:cytochrome P450
MALPLKAVTKNDLDISEIPTFIFAGHETMATITTWCLFVLSRYPEIQRKLREELLSVTVKLRVLPWMN